MLKKTVLAALLGALAGFAAYKLIGCPSGTCPIMSSAFLSVLCGALIGVLAAGISAIEGGKKNKA